MLFCVPVAGCTSSYQPANSPRLAVVMDDGGLTLVREGRSYPVGMFGGDVVDAVRGNPAAEEHAQSYRTQMISGWSFYFGGIGLAVAGTGVWQAGERHNDIGQAHAGEALTVGGLAALFTGIGFLMNAQPHLWDAVNIYNDAVDARLRYAPWPGPLYPPPPYAPPQLPAAPAPDGSGVLAPPAPTRMPASGAGR